MRAGFDRHANLEAGISADLHVLFPLLIAGIAGLAVAGVARTGGPAFAFTTDGEPLQQLSVEPHVELLRPTHAHQVVLVLPPQTNLDAVVSSRREVVARGDAAASPERQIFALPIVLHHVLGNFEHFERGPLWRQRGREPGHLTRHRQVPLQVRRRDRQRVGELVEAAVGGFVAGQLRPHVEIEAEQIADGVVVFRAVQAMDGADSAGVRIGRPRAIELGLEQVDDRIIGLRVRTGPAWRRHRARSKLLDDALPHVSVRGRLARIHRAEGKASRARLVVVTTDAIPIEHRLGRRGRGWRTRLRSRRCVLPCGDLDAVDRGGNRAADH